MTFTIRLALFYGAIFLIVGCFMPYFPVWLKGRGLTAPQIAVIIAAPLVVRVLFTPLISFVADVTGDRRRVLIVLAWGTLGSLIIMAPLQGFWPILAVAMLFGVFWTTVMPLTETVAMDQVKTSGLDYGRVRLWGSATFILASFGGGLIIDGYGAGAVMWLLIGSAVLVVAGVYMLPASTGSGRLNAATTLPPVKPRDAWALARSRVFLVFLGSAACVQAAHAVFYSFGTLHWRALGISSGIIGLLWSVGVIAEIILFVFARRVIAASSATTLLGVAAAAAIVRWTLTAFDPPLAVLFPLQILHGLTYGAAHLGAIHFIASAVPDEYAATGQGLYATFAMGIVMGGATVVVGPLYEAVAGYAYLAMAMLGALSLAGVFLLARLWREGEVIVLNTAEDKQ